MDAFSEVLNGVRLKGAVFFHAEFSAPWELKAGHSGEMAPLLSPGARHSVTYHLVVSGHARVRLAGGTDVDLQPGDIVVLPHGDPHVLANGRGGVPLDGSAIEDKIAARDLSPLQAGGGGAETRLVCGYLSCDPILCGPILDSLPPLLKVNVRTDRTGHWLEQSILHLVEEAAARRAGGEVLLAKLSEALFVDTLRRHMTGLPEHTTGWLAAARDEVIGKSLALMHKRPAHPWTNADLANEVGISRSALVERFTRYLTMPPMAYLTNWRLRLAAEALASTSKGVAAIGADVGYESEAAFNRAFKRAFGTPPARYRRGRREQVEESRS